MNKKQLSVNIKSALELPCSVSHRLNCLCWKQKKGQKQNTPILKSLMLLTFQLKSAYSHTFNWTNHYWRNISCTNVGNNTLIWDFWMTPRWHQLWHPYALHVCVGFSIIPPRQDMSVSIIGESKLPRGASVSAVMDWQPVLSVFLRTRWRKPNVTFISHNQRWKEDRWMEWSEIYWFIFYRGAVETFWN